MAGANTPAPTPATKSALTPAVTPAASALGRRSANTAATAIASPTMTPAKAGSDLAITLTNPPLGTKGSEITTPGRPAGHKTVARNSA